MSSYATLEDRISRGRSSGMVTEDEVIPFPEDWGEDNLPVCLRPGETKDKIFSLLNSGWPLTLYRYRSEAGAVVQIVLRLDHPTEKKKKYIRPLHVRRMIGFRPEVVAAGLAPLRPLYGLERLAVRPEATVILTEGEKAADAGQRRFADHVVMTWQNGAGGANVADFRPLAGRDVIVWPDNDPAGATAAQKVSPLLVRSGVASVRVVQIPPDFPLSWDLANEVPGCA